MSARLLKDPATASSRIFVGHLQTDDMNKTELEEHFSKYGKVMGSLINRGFGFVQFDSEEAARNAIQKEDGSMFKGRRIDVRPAKKDTHGGGGGQGQSGPPGMTGGPGKGSGGPGMGSGGPGMGSGGLGMSGGGPGMGGGGPGMGGGGPGMGGGGPGMGGGGPGMGGGGPGMGGGGPGMGGGGPGMGGGGPGMGGGGPGMGGGGPGMGGGGPGMGGGGGPGMGGGGPGMGGGGPGMGGGGPGMGGGGPGMGGGGGPGMGGGGPGMGGGGPGMGGGGPGMGGGGPGMGGGGPGMGGGGPGMGGGGPGMDTHSKPMGGSNSFGPGNAFALRNNTFGAPPSFGNLNFSGGNQMFKPDSMPGGNQKQGGGPPNRDSGSDNFNDNGPEPDDDDNDQQMSGNDQFNNSGNNQNRGGNNQFGANQNRGNDSFGPGGNNGQGNNQNRNNQFSPGNQNRNSGPNNQNRNQNNQSGNMNQNQNQNQPNQRPRGTRGGKNKNKNHRDGSQSGGNNSFRDRSPIGRGGGGGGGSRGNDDKGGRDWQPRDRNFSRDSFGDGGGRFDDFKGSGGGFGNSSDGPSASADKNDCEIIVVNKILTEYAEMIEMRLKKMGLTVDLLFPNEDVPLSRVLGNIASRGCLYAVVVTPINMEHHSLTLNILHGLPQEHRNMPVDDAISLMGRDFSNYKSGGRSVPLNTPFSNERHPDAIQVLVNMLADNHQLTVLQYDRIIKYLEMKREEQVQIELGDAKDLDAASALAMNDPKQVELQSRILNILNSNKPNANMPVPSPVPAPTPVPPATWALASSSTTSTTSGAGKGVSPSPLLNDPTVQKALDSLLQGNLLKSIGDPQPTPVPTPLFAAFPNIGRF